MRVVQRGYFTAEGAIKATEALLRLPERPTAIVYASDKMALAGYGVLAAHGVRVPQDVSVFGFDDTVDCELAQPPLSTMAQPVEAMAKAALGILTGGTDSGGSQTIDLPVEIILRQSTAPPPRRVEAVTGYRGVVVDSEWSEDELARLPAWTLVQAYHAVAQGFHALFSEHRMTPVQFGVMAQLAATPGLTQAELARRILIRPQSMGELITSLVERGLLVREGPGGKGRPVPVSLTEDGRSALEQAGAAVRAFNDPAALGMTAEEAGQFNELLRQLIRSRSRPSSD